MNISKINSNTDSSFYEIDNSDDIAFITSHPYSREILNRPEIIGFKIYDKLKKPTENILNFLINKYKIDQFNILIIMRGGLNFPIEEAFYNLGINNKTISFITTERVFNPTTSSNINIGYNKIVLLDNATLIIGDIIASGETIRKAINSILSIYIKNKIKLKRIVILTIGTVNTLEIIHHANKEISRQWADFEGVIAFFYEGIFSVYKNQGITKLNTPKIDFSYKSGFTTPEYKYSQLEISTTLFEKCPIYDGGARRFEPYIHLEILLTYWKQLCEICDSIDPQVFISEKLGYSKDCSFGDWLLNNNYTHPSLDRDILENLFIVEKQFLQNIDSGNFINICNMRYKDLCRYFQ